MAEIAKGFLQLSLLKHGALCSHSVHPGGDAGVWVFEHSSWRHACVLSLRQKLSQLRVHAEPVWVVQQTLITPSLTMGPATLTGTFRVTSWLCLARNLLIARGSGALGEVASTTQALCMDRRDVT